MAKDILNRWEISSLDGVNYIWVGLPEGWSGSNLTAACEAKKMLVAVADKFTLPGIHAPNAVRLTLSTVDDLETLTAGLRNIDALLANPPSDMLT